MKVDNAPSMSTARAYFYTLVCMATVCLAIALALGGCTALSIGYDLAPCLKQPRNCN